MNDTDLYEFLEEWHSGTDNVKVRTSGSTGTPKEITISKRKMLDSARMTCRFLGIKSGETALLCLPTRYIAGKMVVVRAEYAGLKLLVAPPSGNPLSNIAETDNITLASMIPLQVYNSLRNEEERVKLSRIGNVIIGGGAVDKVLEEELKDFPNAIYSSYGMTETVSHIALRRLSGPNRQERYYPLEGISISLSSDNTLVIDAPHLCDERLTTNDVAEIFPDGSFVIIGRKDNIINSGGVKIQIEKVEEKLSAIFDSDFAITSVKDAKFGEVVVLLALRTAINQNELSEKIAGVVDKYERPKHIIYVESIPKTPTGKIDRKGCSLLAALHIEQY